MRLLNILRNLLILGLLAVPLRAARGEEAKPSVRFAIVGLTHDHAYGFIPRARGRKDVQLVGIVESKPELVARYASRFQLETNMVDRPGPQRRRRSE
jgi:hypothetical protein